MCVLFFCTNFVWNMNAVVNISTLHARCSQKRIQVCLHVKCPLLVCDFNQIWHVLKHLVELCDSQISLFWDVKLFSPSKVNQCFGGTCHLHLQRKTIFQARNQHEAVRKQRRYTMLYPRRQNSSQPLLWEVQILQPQFEFYEDSFSDSWVIVCT
jgi:hypothetical protein